MENRYGRQSAEAGTAANRQYLSQIPQPSKRMSFGSSAKRVSLGRSSLVDISNSQRASYRNSQRLSYGTGPLLSSRDSRPLRDKAYQASIIKDLLEYLTANGFEIQMNHPVTLKSLRQPTQKDFVMVFKWLYLRLDPGYNFVKSLEHEVYFLLKLVQYPYLDSINKSQISAVGGPNWPSFLGMLHWLMELNVKMEQIALEAQEITSVGDDEDRQEKYELVVERMLVTYMVSSYKSFLQLQDNFLPYFEQLESKFAQFVDFLEKDVVALSQENVVLNKYHSLASQEDASYQLLLKKSEALESDLNKFHHYISTMEQRKQEWPEKLEQIQVEIGKTEAEIVSLEQEKAELQQLFEGQGISTSEIDRKHNERVRITKSLEAVSTRLDEIVANVATKKHDAEKHYHSLQRTWKHYHGLLSQLPVPAEEFTIPSLDGLLEDEKLGLRPDGLLQGLKTNLKGRLTDLYSQIVSKTSNLQQEARELEDQLEAIHEKISNKQEYIDTLEIDLNHIKIQYDELKEVVAAETMNNKVETERLERQIQVMKKNSTHLLTQTQQQHQDAVRSYEAAVKSIQEQRNIMHSKVAQLIEYVSFFKISIQTSLDEFASFASAYSATP